MNYLHHCHQKQDYHCLSLPLEVNDLNFWKRTVSQHQDECIPIRKIDRFSFYRGFKLTRALRLFVGTSVRFCSREVFVVDSSRVGNV